MENKLLLLVVSALAIVLVISTISGCTTSTPTPGTGTGTGTGTGASTPVSKPATTGTPTSPTVVTGAPTVTTAGDKITIAGSEDGTADPKITAGGYIVEVQSKAENADIVVETKSGTVHIMPAMFPEKPDGWNLYNRPEEVMGGEPIKITANGPYVITLTKLPLAAPPATPPKTYKGTGNSVVGPVSLNQGTVTLKGVSGQAVVNLYDATTGESIGVQHDLFKYSPGGVGPADATEDISATGSYLVQVRLSSYGDWELTVSQ